MAVYEAPKVSQREAGSLSLDGCGMSKVNYQKRVEYNRCRMAFPQRSQKRDFEARTLSGFAESVAGL